MNPFLKTIEQVQGWIGSEIDRLNKRKEKAILASEISSLEGSIMSLKKLKDRLVMTK